MVKTPCLAVVRIQSVARFKRSEGDLGSAMKAFEKKFKDKTKNSWDNRANFKKFEGKYGVGRLH